MLSDAEQALLSLLRDNARASTAELARQLGVSRTTVQSRIERLEQRGIIAGYGVGWRRTTNRGWCGRMCCSPSRPSSPTRWCAACRRWRRCGRCIR